MDGGKSHFILRMLAQGPSLTAAFLEKLNWLREVVSTHENRSGPILSTIHSSKGLEYDRVVLLDMLDGILPISSGLSGKFRRRDPGGRGRAQALLSG